MTEEKLSKNEENFRRYMRFYHPEKYAELIKKP